MSQWSVIPFGRSTSESSYNLSELSNFILSVSLASRWRRQPSLNLCHHGSTVLFFFNHPSVVTDPLGILVSDFKMMGTNTSTTPSPPHLSVDHLVSRGTNVRWLQSRSRALLHCLFVTGDISRFLISLPPLPSPSFPFIWQHHHEGPKENDTTCTHTHTLHTTHFVNTSISSKHLLFDLPPLYSTL